MWTHVLVFSEKQMVVKKYTVGVLININLDSPTATVTTSTGDVQVHFAWQQRTPHLAECIKFGKSFRIECNISDAQIVSMTLAVDPERLIKEMNDTNCLCGEVHLVNLLMDVWRDSRVPLNFVPSRYIIDESKLHALQKWNREYPLYEHQKLSVMWMRGREDNDSRFRYSGNIALCDEWYIDTESQCLTKEPSWREADCRGGILADGTGTENGHCIVPHLEQSR